MSHRPAPQAPPVARRHDPWQPLQAFACAVLVLALTVGSAWRSVAPTGRAAAPFLELCSGARPSLLSPGSESRSPRAPAPAELHLQHCPWCCASTPALGMPPAAFGLWVPTQVALVLARLGDCAPAGSPFWPCVRPRPPPAFG